MQQSSVPVPARASAAGRLHRPCRHLPLPHRRRWLLPTKPIWTATRPVFTLHPAAKQKELQHLFELVYGCPTSSFNNEVG